MLKTISKINRIFCALLLSITLMLTNLTSVLAQEAKPQPPFNIEQFKPSKENTKLYGEYRRKWHRLSGFELSSLHWNQFVSIFINQSPNIYRNNYLEYLRSSQDDWDDDWDDEDEEGKQTQSKFKAYPVGTVIAKEGFDSSKGKPGNALFISIMRKREKGYDSANGDWEYLQFDPNGQTLLKGKATQKDVQAQCASCHLNVADRDFIFSSFYTGSIEK